MKLSFLSKLGKSEVAGNKNAAAPQAQLQTTKLNSARVGDSFEVSKKTASPPKPAPKPAPAPAPEQPKKQGFFSKLWGGIKTAAKAVGNAVVGAAKAVGNAIVEGGKKAFEVVSSPVMYGAMKALSAVQTLLGVEPKGRSLKEDEMAMLRSIYGDSIDYSKVQIKEGKAGLISTFNPDRPFVVGNTIYVPSGSMSEDTLVHEMMHVWQYQNGGVDYMGKAVAAQWWGPADPTGGSRGYFYDDDVVAGKPFEKLNPEQQAELIEDAFSATSGRKILPPTEPPSRFIINGVDRTDYVLHAWDMIKAGQGAP